MSRVEPTAVKGGSLVNPAGLKTPPVIGLVIRSIEVIAGLCMWNNSTAATLLGHLKLEKGQKKRRMLRCGDAQCQGLQPIGRWICRRRTLIVSESLRVNSSWRLLTRTRTDGDGA